MFLHKKKESTEAAGNRVLITVTVIGSAGPIQFVAKEEKIVAAVIYTALKSYARQGRLPVLGFDVKDFLLYCPYTDAMLPPWERIGSVGARNFLLCKKPKPPQAPEVKVACNGGSAAAITQSRTGKNWMNKSPHSWQN